MEKKYLFQVNIGPVQGFIASARRTRDLWFGSALLSRLAMEAAILIKESKIVHAHLIFPSPDYIEEAKKNKNEPGKDGDISVPNKIVATIDSTDPSAITQLGDAVQQKLNEERDRIKDIAYGRANNQFDRNAADKQIADLIEFRWVALPYIETEYDDKRKQLELLMAARKNANEFKPVTWGRSTAKSSIDGQLECVIFNDWYPRRADSTEKRFEKQAVLYRHFRAGPSERLSGVDLLKRCGDFYEKTADEKKSDKQTSESGFPSTSHIATIPYLERLSNLDSDITAQLKKKWDDYIEELKNLKRNDRQDVPYLKDFHDQVIEHVRGYNPPAKKNICPHPIFNDYDGAMLFHEHFLDIVTDKEHLNTSAKALQSFFKAVKEQVGEKLPPQPYYAILQADGDGMGKAIDAQAEKGADGHRELSKQIDKFAEDARKIVSEHLGATIYAGGDDVLALVPIHTALACAAELSSTFKELLKSFKDKDGNKPTLSVGIAIVHHLELLSEALSVARRAEKKAKGYKKEQDKKWIKKDALAIIVSKRSGEEYDIAGRWGDLNSFLDRLIDYYRDEIIPKGTAYELRESALRLDAKDLNLTPKETDSQKKIIARHVLKAEAERILQRKLLVGQGKGSKRENAEQALGLLEQRLGIPEELKKGKWDKKSEITSTMEEFVHELVIAEMLADAQRLAGIQKGEGQK